MTPLVVVDADVLGRERTGDETYVLNLLRELAPLAPAAGLRIAAVTRDPELVPEGIEAVRLATSSQELRMAVTLPRLLRGLGAALGALPVRAAARDYPARRSSRSTTSPSSASPR